MQGTDFNSKPHLLLLDALRGVAALIVLCYHCFEGFATSVVNQGCNHGYLAVDFFFILSGFVIGYSYDDRLGDGSITARMFFRRRLVRLHPMVVFGAVFGLLCFIIGGCRNWAGESAPTGFLLLALLLNLFMIPLCPGAGADVRGNGEMFPLNGPNWSLFFEYIGNVLYVLLLRKLPTKILAALTLLLGGILTYICISTGYLGIGWTLPDFWGGLVRMLFPYCLGMLLSRLFLSRAGKPSILPKAIRGNAFIICSILLLVLLTMPFVGSESRLWQNGLYVSVIILFVFPFLIWTAAEGSRREQKEGTKKLQKFLGELSYPLYSVHYPIMYLFYQYIGFPNVDRTMSEVWPVALGAAALSIAVAYLALVFYEKPIRRRLT